MAMQTWAVIKLSARRAPEDRQDRGWARTYALGLGNLFKLEGNRDDTWTAVMRRRPVADGIETHFSGSSDIGTSPFPFEAIDRGKSS